MKLKTKAKHVTELTRRNVLNGKHVQSITIENNVVRKSQLDHFQASLKLPRTLKHQTRNEKSYQGREGARAAPTQRSVAALRATVAAPH